MCHDNEEWCKVWRGIEVSFQSWHDQFDKVWPEHSKFSKIFTLMGSFWPKYIMFELKTSTEELCLMSLKIRVKFQGKLTCAFKKDMRNLENFHSLKDSNFILERKMAELNKNKKLKATRSTRCSIKTLFYLGNKWITQLTKILTNVLLKFSEAISYKLLQMFYWSFPNLHIFLGHDCCFWKINLRILWDHIIKKFQVKHGQCDSIIFSKTLSFERTSQLKYFDENRILFFW